MHARSASILFANVVHAKSASTLFQKVMHARRASILFFMVGNLVLLYRKQFSTLLKGYLMWKVCILVFQAPLVTISKTNTNA